MANEDVSSEQTVKNQAETRTTTNPRKRKSTQASNANRNNKKTRTKGKLATLLTGLPTETVLDICTYLSPTDLLNLVRSGRVFASFLLAPAMSSVWRAARLQVEDLPDCPDEMTEQKYANFVYGNGCSNCGRITRSLDHIFWNLLIKLCERCKKSVVRGEVPSYRIIPESHHPFGLALCLQSPLSNPPSVLFRTTDLKAMQQKLEDIHPSALESFLKNRTSKLTHQAQIGSSLSAFFNKLERERAEGLRLIRMQKIEDLKTRLIGLGLPQDIIKSIPPQRWQDYPTMTISKPLTNATWIKIRPQVEQMFQKMLMRIKALVTEGVGRALARSYQYGYEPKHPQAFRPRFDLLFCSPMLTNILAPCIDDHYLRLFQDLLVTSSDTQHWHTGSPFTGSPFYITRRLDGIKNTLHSLGFGLDTLPISQAASSIEGQLQAHFLDRIIFSDSLMRNATTLDLAICLFKGLETTGPSLETRGLPWFQCMRTKKLSIPERYPASLNDPADYPHLAEIDEKVEFDAMASEVMARIVLACGLNPMNCTHADMEALNPMVVCLRCSDGPSAGHYRLTMAWDEAPLHWIGDHLGLNPHLGAWAVLNHEEAATFAKHLKEGSVRSVELFHCRLCALQSEEWESSQSNLDDHEKGFTLARMEQHLRFERHGLCIHEAVQSPFRQKMRPLEGAHPVMWNANTSTSRTRTAPPWWNPAEPWVNPERPPRILPKYGGSIYDEHWCENCDDFHFDHSEDSGSDDGWPYDEYEME